MSVHNLRCLLFIGCSLYASGVAAQANQIELGTGYRNNDVFRPGQYSGFASEGSFAVGGFNLYGPAQSTRHWRIEGTDLGLETSKLKASYGNWGSYLLNFTFQQLPHSEIGNALSPFTGYGSANQRLPAGWIGAASTTGFTALNSALYEFDIDKKRQRFTGDFNLQLNPNWELNAEYRHETKEGKDTLGAIFGSTGGNPKGALLARPIDFTTSEIRLGLDQVGTRTQYGIGYSLMHFENQNKALRWDNPFNNPQWLAAASFSNAATGQLALEPNNESSQINFYAGHNFTAGTRLSASLTRARLLQDDNYLPYSSVITAPTALPGADLNGEVETLTANLNFSSRLNQRSTLRLRYSYRERDNQTQQSLYQRIAGDSASQATLLSDGARVNRIYDQAIDRFSLDLDYRFTGRTRASVGYEVEENDRSMVDVEATTEQTGFLKLDFRPFSTASAWVKMSHAERETAGLDTTRPLVAGHSPEYVATLVGAELFQNDPYLRRFHISARDRNELSGALNYYPTASVGVNLLGRASSDDYPNTLAGLQESDTRMLAVDLSYSPDADWSAGLFYNFENYHNRQAGYSRSGGANPTPAAPVSARDTSRNWRMQSEDLVHTVGGSLSWAPMGGQLALSLDATYADAVTESDPYSSGLVWLPYPDITTQITSLAAKGVYQLSPGRELRLRYFYEHYRSADYALDNVLVDTLANILLLGNQSPRYTGHVFEVSVVLDLP